MSFITGMLSKLTLKIRNNVETKSKYIFYKIVDYFKEDNAYLLQCINTKATFRLTLTELVFDIDILYGLHPIQACYIGLEYSKLMQNNNQPQTKKQKDKIKASSVCRYGEYKLCFQNRKGDMCFFSRKTHKEFIMDPLEIARAEELINQFDAAQTFYIGLLAGLKLKMHREKAINTEPLFIAPHLRLVVN